SNANSPVRLAWWGRISRWESRCSRRYASAVSFGGSASDATDVRTISVRRSGSARGPTSRSGSALSTSAVTASSVVVPRPSQPSGYHTSSTVSSLVTVARPAPHAGEVETVMSADAPSTPAAATGRLPSLFMANPLTPPVLADPVALTRALVDIESVSGNEQQLADYVEEVLRGVGHLSVARHHNTVMARTELGHPQRVVLAGHLDTVPVADNLPARLEGDLLYGCGTSDMKSGVALALHLAVTLTEPRYDLTYFFYEAEEVESERNGLHLVSRAHPEWLAADFAVLL